MYKEKKDKRFNDRKRDFDDRKKSFEAEEKENDKDIIFGRNSVTEAIKAGRPIDSVMVARGDMGVEIPMEDIPVIQKTLITKCYNSGKGVKRQ